MFSSFWTIIAGVALIVFTIMTIFRSDAVRRKAIL